MWNIRKDSVSEAAYFFHFFSHVFKREADRKSMYMLNTLYLHYRERVLDCRDRMLDSMDRLLGRELNYTVRTRPSRHFVAFDTLLRVAERRQFERRQMSVPVEVDRRSGADRRTGLDRRSSSLKPGAQPA